MSDTQGSLADRVGAVPYWYHRIALPGGLVTPGWAPRDPAAYPLPADLSGKRVLDVGAWDGYWSFAALERGAAEVVAIDDLSDSLGLGADPVSRSWGGFDLARAALGWGEAHCSRRTLSVLEATEQSLGRFDVVLLFGTLYHLRYPLLALDRLAAICDETLCVESAVLDHYSPYRGGLGRGYPGGQMVAEFYPGAEYGGTPTNWWVPTLHCLAAMVVSAGFGHVEAWSATSEAPDHVSRCRGFVRASRTP